MYYSNIPAPEERDDIYSDVIGVHTHQQGRTVGAFVLKTLLWRNTASRRIYPHSMISHTCCRGDAMKTLSHIVAWCRTIYGIILAAQRDCSCCFLVQPASVFTTLEKVTFTLPRRQFGISWFLRVARRTVANYKYLDDFRSWKPSKVNWISVWWIWRQYFYLKRKITCIGLPTPVKYSSLLRLADGLAEATERSRNQ